MAKRGPKPFPPEKIQMLQACVDDQWPLRQIEETFGVSHRTMKRYFPDYRGEPDYELAGEISYLMEKLGMKVSPKKMAVSIIRNESRVSINSMKDAA